MKTKQLLIFSSFIAVILLGTFIYLIYTESGGIFSGRVTLNFKENNGEWPDVNKENFQQYIISQQIVKDLPENSEISLRLTNSEGFIEKNYILSRNSIKEGDAENPDIVIMLNSKYIGELENGLCETISKAKQNNNLIFETKINIVEFLWKYRNSVKYRNCFAS